MSFVYVPILQTKQNEYAALNELSEDVKTAIKPLLSLTEVDKERRSREIPRQVAEKWGNYPCYIDLNTSEDFQIEEENYFKWIGQKCSERGLQNIDFILSLDSTQTAIQSTASIISTYGFSLALRISITELNTETNSNIEALLASCNKRHDEIDIIIDFAENVAKTSFIHQQSIAQVLNTINKISLFKNIVIAGSSIPKDLPRESYNPHGFEPRTEWISYLSLVTPYIGQANSRIPVFGDYAGVHPEEFLSNTPVKPNAKIKYTHEDNYMIVVRYQAHVHDDGFGQYFDMANYIVNSGYFYGSNYSSGDKYIDDCSKRKAGPGNFGTWVKVGVNHHITLAVSQNAKLHGPSR